MSSLIPYGGGLGILKQRIQRHPHNNHDDANIPEVVVDMDTIELNEHIRNHPGLQSRRSSRSTTGGSIQMRSNRSFRFSDVASESLHSRMNHPSVRRHGHDTFGEMMLHPIREYEAHRRHAKHHHGETEASEKNHTEKDEAPTLQEDPPLVKTFIHFRHLIGSQKLRITKAVVDQLEKPLGLTEDEVHRLFEMEDTDELIEFFHKSKREYALKIHKTIRIKDKDESRRQKSKDLEAQDNTHNGNDIVVSDATSPDVSVHPGSTVIHLNDNVYLELKEITPEQEQDRHRRRPIFLVPDPDLSDEIGEETTATWLELFGDVFYVGLLASFTHEHHIVDQQQLGVYAAWFVVLWWTWCASALYSSRYDRSDVMHHIYKIVELCGLVGMAGASNNYWNEPRGFIIGYLVMKGVLLIEYSVVLWAAVVSGSFARKPLAAYVLVHAFALIMWGISLVFRDNRAARFSLWYTSIFVELLVHMFCMGNKHVSLAASHLAERFALFTIIVLGENCMGFVRTVMEMGTEVRVVVANMLGLVIIVLFFFMYFDDFSTEVLSEVDLSQLWMYLHFPLHLCQVAFGIALTDTISIYNDSIYPSIEPAGHASASLHKALLLAAAEAEAVEGEADASEVHTDPSYVFKSFWIAGGLIILINGLIKLVNTPVTGAKWSYIVCLSRLLNAIAFFAMTATHYDHLNGMTMLIIMAVCLLFQAAVDLLD